MSDRTRHVIDAIDHALDDWTVSDDAMRWTPEPVIATPGVDLLEPSRVGSRWPGRRNHRCVLTPIYTDAAESVSAP